MEFFYLFPTHAGIFIDEGEDSLVWERNVLSRLVSVKCAYEVLVSRKIFPPPRWWVKGMWKGSMPLKVKCFSWLLLHNKILVWENLQRRGYIGPSNCSSCGADLESVEHLFLQCTFFKVVWRKESSHFDIFFNWYLDTLEDCVLCWFGRMKKLKFFPYFLFWEIWKN